MLKSYSTGIINDNNVVSMSAGLGTSLIESTRAYRKID